MSLKKSILLAASGSLLFIASTSYAGPPEGKGKANKGKKPKHKIERVEQDMRKHGKDQDARTHRDENRRDSDHRMEDAQRRDGEHRQDTGRQDANHRMDDGQGRAKGQARAQEAQEKSYEHRQDADNRMDEGQGRAKGKMKAQEAKARSEERRQDGEHRMDGDRREDKKVKDGNRRDRDDDHTRDHDDERRADNAKAKKMKADRTIENAKGEGKKKGWFASWREKRAARKAAKKTG